MSEENRADRTPPDPEATVVVSRTDPEATVVVPKRDAEATVVVPKADPEATVAVPRSRPRGSAGDADPGSGGDPDTTVVAPGAKADADPEATVMVPKADPEATVVARRRSAPKPAQQSTTAQPSAAAGQNLAGSGSVPAQSGATEPGDHPGPAAVASRAAAPETPSRRSSKAPAPPQRTDFRKPVDPYAAHTARIYGPKSVTEAAQPAADTVIREIGPPPYADALPAAERPPLPSLRKRFRRTRLVTLVSYAVAVAISVSGLAVVARIALG